MTTDPTVGSADRIAQQRRGGAVILRPTGELDREVADDLRLRALEAHAPVIIDLDGCVRLDGTAVHALVESWAFYRPELGLVCGSAGDRWMLTSLDVARPLPIFATVDEALAACRADGHFRPPSGGAPGGLSAA